MLELIDVKVLSLTRACFGMYDMNGCIGGSLQRMGQCFEYYRVNLTNHLMLRT
jgi:hypothetical protein